ncbi:MAG: hypothetical protein AAFP22_00950 [Planctomycetota bacterium]
MQKAQLFTLVAALGLSGVASAQIELAENGGFETGDTTGWTSFPSPTSTFDVTMDSNSGMFAAELVNDFAPSGAVIKNDFIGAGQVQPGDRIIVSFAAKGMTANGGVVFAEFFSEGAMGVSMAEILGGGPLPITDQWQSFCFTTTAGPDVAQGVTFQLGAITGAVDGSISMVTVDDVSVSIESAEINGGFETGDTTGWDPFLTPNATFNVTGDANTGSFAGEIQNPDFPAGAVVKNANIGAGSIQPGDMLEISLSAKGELGVSGVIFVEFFSEVAGGGVSMAEILGGGPLPITSDYQDFTFTAMAGPDVSGGVTVQIGAITGAVDGAFANVTFDDVSVRSLEGVVRSLCGTTPNSVGPGAVMSASGSAGVAAQNFTLETSGLPPFQFGLYWAGTSETRAVSFDGTRCIDGFTRLEPVVMADASGNASLALPDSVYMANGGMAPMVGTSLFYQLVYRDFSPNGANWSDALCVTFGN